MYLGIHERNNWRVMVHVVHQQSHFHLKNRMNYNLVFLTISSIISRLFSPQNKQLIFQENRLNYKIIGNLLHRNEKVF